MEEIKGPGMGGTTRPSHLQAQQPPVLPLQPVPQCVHQPEASGTPSCLHRQDCASVCQLVISSTSSLFPSRRLGVDLNVPTL